MDKSGLVHLGVRESQLVNDLRIGLRVRHFCSNECSILTASIRCNTSVLYNVRDCGYYRLMKTVSKSGFIFYMFQGLRHYNMR
jgi:hypothetical protein